MHNPLGGIRILKLSNDNYILIKGGSYEKVKKALKEWIEMYSKDMNMNSTFSLFKSDKGQYVIQADDKLDNDRFYYLVNYLKHPIDIDDKVDVIGYTKGKQENQLKNRDLQVYIHENDKDGDNVYVTTEENKNYKINFSGEISQINNNVRFEKNSIPKYSNVEILKNNKNKISINKDTKRNKRFKLITSIIVGAYTLLILLLTMKWQTAFLVKSLWFLNLGVALWFFTDYELLTDKVIYLWSVIIAISLIPYTLWVINKFGIHSFHTSISSSLHAIVLLMIQLPLRILFIKAFKVEPEIDKTGNMKNMGYTFILAMGMIILPFLIEDLINK